MRLPWVSFADEISKTEGYTRQRDPALGYPPQRALRRPSKKRALPKNGDATRRDQNEQRLMSVDA